MPAKMMMTISETNNANRRYVPESSHKSQQYFDFDNSELHPRLQQKAILTVRIHDQCMYLQPGGYQQKQSEEPSHD